jgi:hypothetical protein
LLSLGLVSTALQAQTVPDAGSLRQQIEQQRQAAPSPTSTAPQAASLPEIKTFDGMTVTVAGNVTVSGRYGGLSLGGALTRCGSHHAGHYRYNDGARPTLTVGGNFTVSSLGKVFVYSARTNGTPGRATATV